MAQIAHLCKLNVNSNGITYCITVHTSKVSHELVYCLCRVSHVLSVFTWVSSLFSSCPLTTQKHVIEWISYAKIACKWACEGVCPWGPVMDWCLPTLCPVFLKFTTTLTRLLKVIEFIHFHSFNIHLCFLSIHKKQIIF